MMVIVMIAAFMVSLLLGLLLLLCLLLTALVGFLFVDLALLANTLPQCFFGGMDISSLMAIPLLVLVGNLMNHSGITSRLMRLANVLVGHFHGGLGHVNVVAGAFFVGVNGSTVADASVLSTLLASAMEKEGYSQRFAAGPTAGSSLTGPIIPPNTFMILYSSLINTSVGEPSPAGAIPGLLLAVAFMLLNAVYAHRNGLQARHMAPV